MSEPKRYTLEMVSSEVGHIHWMHDNEEGLSAPLGDFVRWEDYAALLATNERVCLRFAKTQIEADEAEKKAEILMEKMEMMNAPFPGLRYQQMKDEIAALKAEVERLRKAGDWMCGLLQFDFVTKEWNAAKEGKPSA